MDAVNRKASRLPASLDIGEPLVAGSVTGTGNGPGERKPSRVAFAGDWHGNVGWVQRSIPLLHRFAPDVTQILHAGDFGYGPGREQRGFLAGVDFWAKTAGVTSVLVTPGNHEHWDRLNVLFAASPGEPVRISDVVTMLPRGHRFSLGGRTFMSFGGAASVDFEYRIPGDTWFKSEIPTDEDVARAISAGPVDVLITHETVDGGTRASQRALDSNPFGWSLEALDYSALSRGRVTRLWDALRPKLLAHGHMHSPDFITLPDGRRVISLGRDRQEHNMAILDLDPLETEWVE